METIIKKKYTKSAILNSVFLSLTVIHIILISLVILPDYVNGDQFDYRRLYSGLEGLSLSDGFIFYNSAVGSEEPIYFLFSWVLSNLGIEKDTFIIIANAILGIVGYKTLLRLGSKPYIAYIIISFNFYFLVFYFSAERLKFALIFLFLSYLVKKVKWLYVFLSILSHSQVLIFYTSILAPKLKFLLYNVFIKFKLKYRYIWIAIALIAGTSIVLAVLGNHLSTKLEAYYTTDSSIIDLLRMLAFFALSFLYSKKKIDTLYAFFPLLLLVFFLGGERVNFIGYFVFLYFSIHYRGGLNLGVILTNIYFIIVGFSFLQNILNYGDGFYLQ